MAILDRPSLDQFDVEAWRALETATADPHAPFRYLTLCSVDSGGCPQARTVVLRRADTRSRQLEFHTDIRSRKWVEFAQNPKATVIGYCGSTRLQIRLQGHVARHEPESAIGHAAWESLPEWTRTTYAGGPPGDELALGAGDPEPLPANGIVQNGKDRFGVLIFTAESLDWFQLRRSDNLRAQFRYADDKMGWVNP